MTMAIAIATAWAAGHILMVSVQTASWYGDECRGKPMANTKPFDPDQLTCASWFHPLGARLIIQTEDGTRSVEVKVTDRGPNKRLLKTRQIDLSRAAFIQLAPLEKGLVKVRVARIQSGDE